MFLDEVRIKITSGAGGNGCVSWRKEKYVPYGGPAGGDGGRGASIYFEATENMQTLLDFRYNQKFEGDHGQKGQGKNCHGRGADDMIVYVPVGTVVKDAELNTVIADFSAAGQRALMGQGGRGGRGNPRFANSNNKAPHYAEPGEPGVERELILELKLLADIGLLGMPNAGKSTLISVVSSAKPKIANYPFTTIVPNLGVMRRDTGDGVVIADIPGLIEGASEGIGLGHAFLRHVERCRLLLHLVDATAGDGGTPWGNYETIRHELMYYSEPLAEREEIIVLTKSDAMLDDEFAELIKEFKVKSDKTVLGISAVARVGLEELKAIALERLDTIPRDLVRFDVMPDEKATANDDSHFDIEVVDDEEGVFRIHGGKILRWWEITNMENFQALSRFWNVMKSMGVFNALDAHGAKRGDTIIIGPEMYEYAGSDAEITEADFDDYSKFGNLNEDGDLPKGIGDDDIGKDGKVMELSLDDWEDLLDNDDSDLSDWDEQEAPEGVTNISTP